MAETVLAAVATAGALAAILVTYSLARRTAPAADGATDPVTSRPDAAPRGTPEPAPVTATDPDTWQSETVSELAAAEELLDRAEAEGYQERELVLLSESAFLVRWRRPRGTSAGPAGQ